MVLLRRMFEKTLAAFPCLGNSKFLWLGMERSQYTAKEFFILQIGNLKHDNISLLIGTFEAINPRVYCSFYFPLYADIHIKDVC